MNVMGRPLTFAPQPTDVANWTVATPLRAIRASTILAPMEMRAAAMATTMCAILTRVQPRIPAIVTSAPP